MERAAGVLNIPPSLTEADSFLLARVQRGDQEAMMALFDRYAVLVYSVALRALRDGAEAGDVVQEIFLGVWREPEALLAMRGSVGGWLALTSRNCSITQLRRRPEMKAVGEVALFSSCNLGDETERDRMIERTHATLRQLPERQRKALEMAFFDGLTPAEIAEITADGLGAVKSGIGGALVELRKGCRE